MDNEKGGGQPMPRPKKAAPQIVDLLADDDTEDDTQPADEPASKPVVELVTVTMDQPPARPVPESQLSSEQKRIRELENQLALERGKKDPERELELVPNPGDEANILIHFLEDGLTANGEVWRRGQEVEFVPGSRAYQDTCNRHGWSWLELRYDEMAQVERFGKVMFRPGRWPGKPLSAVLGAPFTQVFDQSGRRIPPPGPEEVARAEQLEAKRNRAAPRLALQ
jgi:hypothetical protein